ncbi:hypothetical protein [Agrobacterium larrymoorei]|uniref:Uncharacterized protein n=1 Tax=Agrobacterium larrymoorei TaxID=160699 RepID=A0A4D7E0T6_9HYPH|nr:hypothetical protein [Agrobacterium larrymoorei]QCJ00875.1 hypothetical protein CFBP5473_23005 [Agrobacterium larrymoorei]QYA10211.1 hypothetical protein J5285_23675 [Agrobacterium larrymoorei]
MGGERVEIGDFEAASGLRPNEVMDGHDAALTLLQNKEFQAALRLVEVETPGSTDSFYNALIARSFDGSFGNTGKALFRLRVSVIRGQGFH